MHCACPAISGRTAASHLAANAGNPVPGQPAVASSAGTPVKAPVPSPALVGGDLRLNQGRSIESLALAVPYPDNGSYDPTASVPRELHMLQNYGLAVSATGRGANTTYTNAAGRTFALDFEIIRVKKNSHPLYDQDVAYVLTQRFAGGEKAKQVLLLDGTLAASWDSSQGLVPNGDNLLGQVAKLASMGPRPTASAVLARSATVSGVTRSNNLAPDWDTGIVVNGSLTPAPMTFDEVLVRTKIHTVGTRQFVEYEIYHPNYGVIARVNDNAFFHGSNTPIGISFRVTADAWSSQTNRNSRTFDSFADAVTAVVEWTNKYGVYDKAKASGVIPAYYPATGLPYDPLNPVSAPMTSLSRTMRQQVIAAKMTTATTANAAARAALVAATTPVAPAPAPVAAPAALTPLTRPIMIDSAVLLGKKTGAAAGSNTAGVSGFWTGTDGVKRYVKQYATPEQAITELLSFRIYEALGVAVPESFLSLDPATGALLIATNIVDNTGVARATSTTAAREILAGNSYAADMLLANYDVMGAGGNVVLGKDGRTYRIDAGGTLEFRAQGALKSGPMDNVKRTFLSMLERNTAYGDLLIKAKMGLADRTADPSTFSGLAAQVSAIRDLLLPNGATSIEPLIQTLLAGLDPKVSVPGYTATTYAKHLADFLDPRLDSLLRFAKVPAGSKVGTTAAPTAPVSVSGPLVPPPTLNAPQGPALGGVGAPQTGQRVVATPIIGDRIRQKLISLTDGWKLTHPDGGTIGVLLGPAQTGTQNQWTIRIEGGPEFTSTSVHTARSMAAKWINQNGVVDVSVTSATAANAAAVAPVALAPKTVKIDPLRPIPDKLTVDLLRHKVEEGAFGESISVGGGGTLTADDGSVIKMDMRALADGKIILADRDGGFVAEVLYRTVRELPKDADGTVTSAVPIVKRRNYEIRFADGKKVTFSYEVPAVAAFDQKPRTDAEIRAVKKAVFAELVAMKGIPKTAEAVAGEKIAASLTHKVVAARERKPTDAVVAAAPKPLGEKYAAKRARSASPRRNGGTIITYKVAFRNERKIVQKGDPKGKHPHRRQVFAAPLDAGAPTEATTLKGTRVRGKALPKVEIADGSYVPTLAEDVVVIDGKTTRAPKVERKKTAETADVKFMNRWELRSTSGRPGTNMPRGRGARGAFGRSFTVPDAGWGGENLPGPEGIVIGRARIDERLRKLREAVDAHENLGDSVPRDERGYKYSFWTHWSGAQARRSNEGLRPLETAAVRTVLEGYQATLDALPDQTGTQASVLRDVIRELTETARLFDLVDTSADAAYFDAYEQAVYAAIEVQRQQALKWVEDNQAWEKARDAANADPKAPPYIVERPEKPEFYLPTFIEPDFVSKREASILTRLRPDLEFSDNVRMSLGGIYPKLGRNNTLIQPDYDVATRGIISTSLNRKTLSMETMGELFGSTAVRAPTVEGLTQPKYDGDSKIGKVAGPTWVRKARAEGLRSYADGSFAIGSEMHQRLTKLADLLENNLRLDLTKDGEHAIRLDWESSETAGKTFAEWVKEPSTLFEGGTRADDIYYLETMIIMGMPLRYPAAHLPTHGDWLPVRDRFNVLAKGEVAGPGYVTTVGRTPVFYKDVDHVYDLRTGDLDDVAFEVIARALDASNARDIVFAIKLPPNLSDADMVRLEDWGFVRGRDGFADHAVITTGRAVDLATKAFGSLTGGGGGGGKSSSVTSSLSKKTGVAKVVSTRFRPLKPLVDVDASGALRIEGGISVHDLLAIVQEQTSGFSASLPDGGKISSPAINSLWSLLGLMDPPAVVPAEGFADLIGPGTVIHVRGDKRALYRDQLLGYPVDPAANGGNGSMRFSGSGVYGDGQYAQAFSIPKTTGAGAERLVEIAIDRAWGTTRGYTGSTADYGRVGPRSIYLISENVSHVTVAALKTKADKVIQKLYDAARDKASTDKDAARDLRELADALERLSSNDNGNGLLAMLLGYDVLVAGGNDYSILLNPTAAIYLEDSLSTQEATNDPYKTVRDRDDEMKSWTLRLLTAWHTSKTTKSEESEGATP